MADIDTTSHKLADALKSQEADYIEVRVAESRTGQVMYRGKQLESIGRTTTIGGSVRALVNGGWRALVNGGWGFVSFNDFDDIAEKVALAVKQARFVGNETSLFAPVDPVVEVVPCTISENPVTIPLADKKALLDEYNDIIWATDGIQTSNIGYSDGHKRVIFLNSEGSRIEQERTDVTLRVVAVAAKDGEVQQVGISIGGRDDFTAVRNLHSRVEELANKAVSVLSAPKVKGGEYTVVLDPVLAGKPSGTCLKLISSTRMNACVRL